MSDDPMELQRVVSSIACMKRDLFSDFVNLNVGHSGLISASTEKSSTPSVFAVQWKSSTLSGFAVQEILLNGRETCSCVYFDSD